MHGAKWKLKASEKPFKVVAEGATKCDDSTDLWLVNAIWWYIIDYNIHSPIISVEGPNSMCYLADLWTYNYIYMRIYREWQKKWLVGHNYNISFPGIQPLYSILDNIIGII